MEKKINFSGIVRNTSGVNSPAGSCHELINLRKKYESWRPILPKKVVKANFTSTNNTVFIHSMDEAVYFVVYNPADGTVKAYNSSDPFAYVETIATIATGKTVRFDALGYFLLLTNTDDYTKNIYRCNPSLGTKYTDVSNIPSLDISLASTATANVVQQFTNPDQESFQAGWWLLEKKARETFPDYFEGFVFMRYAVELIDGTVLKHSRPVFIYNGAITANMDNPLACEILSTYHQLTYTLPAALPSDWTNYASLIRGISFFMSKPITKFDVEASGYNGYGVFTGLVEKSTLLIDLFRNESAYYRVHHIPFNKVIAGGTGIIGGSKPVVSTSFSRSSAEGARGDIVTSSGRRDQPSAYSGGGDTAAASDVLVNPAMLNINDITAYDLLNVDDVSHHSIVGMRTLNYNSRLWLGDIYTRLFDGYNISSLITPTGNTIGAFQIYLEVDISTELGVKTVRQQMNSTKDAIIIPYLIGYPDLRATEIRILHNQPGSIKKMVISLESHPLLNLATANKIGGTDITAQAKSTTGLTTITIASITTAGALATLQTSLRDKNRVQATELYNPFVTPAIYSYQIGEGNIIGLSVNMIALDDKFGTFPIFVFSSRGIWALNLSDSGSIVVSNITALSSSVCINPYSILTIDNVIAFLASDGIKLLTGQVPAEVSDIAEGSHVSPVASDSVYLQVKVHEQIANVSTLLSSTDILTYAAGARFAYNKTEREIIVSNYAYGYSYIYSIDNKSWYKSSQRFRDFIMHYPNVYALSTGNDLVNIAEEITSGDVPVYIETRPILLEPERGLKIDRVILEGKFDIAGSYYGMLSIYGSNDGSVWKFISGKEVHGANLYNITLTRLPFSLRFVVLVFSGTVTKDSSVTGLRLEV